MSDKIQMLSRGRGEVSIRRETGYIVRKAKHRDARVVKFGPVVLFSTHTGDAWLLDPEDQLALCLARDGVEQEYTVVDTQDNYQIHWNAHYHIEDEAFSVADREGRVATIMGYPTDEIVRVAGMTM